MSCREGNSELAIFVMILRKMWKNKWLEFSLLSGLILSVALVSSMPIYTNAILQRMLVKDLENMQKYSQQYPGSIWSSIYLTDESAQDARAKINFTDSFMQTKAGPGFGLPILHYVRTRGTSTYKFVPADTGKIDGSINRTAEIDALEGIEDHIRLVDGRLPAKEPVNGVYEALVLESMLTSFKMVLGNEFVVQDDNVKQPVKIKPVGVFEKKDDSDVYWQDTSLSGFRSSFLIPFELFERDMTTSKVLPIRSSSWYFALDYSDMNLSNVFSFISMNEAIVEHAGMYYFNHGEKAPALVTIQTYFDRAEKLRAMLWSLNVPVMIMLVFYLFMVANLITERQKTEIAVLRSRGASRLQVLAGYAAEALLLGGVAFAAGPFVGMWLTKLLGSSSGFLEFVQRSALHAEVDREALRYALYAVGCSFVTMLIPAFLATRTSIVGHKQQQARQKRSSFWHKFFIDIVLVAVSIYGLTTFERQRRDMLTLGIDSSTLTVDPLLFLVPALFVLGTGLLLLRIYPWFVRFVYWIGKKWWPPSLYATLIQVGRSGVQYQFLMIFLIMTIAIGLYSASAARTINQNTDDKIMYANGADMILKTAWENDAPPPPMPGAPEPAPTAAPKRIQYTEPPFTPFTQLTGVEHAAKVFVRRDAVASSGKESTQVGLMGIDTDDFGRTAWLRDGLLDHHLYDYLNLLAGDSKAAFVSRTYAEQKGVKPGDTIYIGWVGAESRTFVVYGIVDYWPTFNPNPPAPSASAAASAKDKKPVAPMFVIAHLDYIQSAIALEPYDVWIKLAPGAQRQTFYDEIAARKLPVTAIVDTREQLINARNDPFQLAVNGVMTLGFLISMAISFFGFLLYWVLSLGGRILQLGILRAMGISFLQVIGMLVAEQLLTSGAAIAIGIATGNVTSELFVGLFQITFNPATQVPPFRVTFKEIDSLRIYAIVTVMIACGMTVLGVLLSRIKIHQAVKLGED